MVKPTSTGEVTAMPCPWAYAWARFPLQLFAEVRFEQLVVAAETLFQWLVTDPLDQCQVSTAVHLLSKHPELSLSHCMIVTCS